MFVECGVFVEVGHSSIELEELKSGLEREGAL